MKVETIEIFCDSCGEGRKWVNKNQNINMNLSYKGQWLKNVGWRIGSDGDYCPRCRRLNECRKL